MKILQGLGAAALVLLSVVTMAPRAFAADEQQQAFYRFVELFTAEKSCPRFHVISGEVERAAEDAGIKDPNDVARVAHEVAVKNDPSVPGGYSTFVMVGMDYSTNPSRWCKDIWDRYGPQGTYQRQLVE